MTFNQLRRAEKVCNEKILRLNEDFMKKQEQYIKEHAPLELQKGDWIIIRLEVTKESRNALQPEYQELRRYRLGNQHNVRGQFCRWLISETGELRPDLMGKTWYPWRERIVSITKCEKQ